MSYSVVMQKSVKKQRNMHVIIQILTCTHFIYIILKVNSWKIILDFFLKPFPAIH